MLALFQRSINFLAFNIKNIFYSILPSFGRKYFYPADILFIVSLGFIFGVSFVFIKLMWLAVSILVFLFIFSIFAKEKIHRLIYLVFGASFLIGVGYGEMRATERDFLVGDKISLTGKIINYPEESLSNTTISIKHQGFLIFTKVDQNIYHLGDLVSVNGSISYVRGRSVYLLNSKVYLIEENNNNLFLFFSNLRSFIRDRLSSALPLQSTALALGLLIGDDSYFSKEIKNNLLYTGTIHIVALSGWNVLLIVAFLKRISDFFFNRFFVFIITLSGIIFLLLLAGPSPSLIRASIMGFLGLFASLIGREYYIRNSVFVTGAVMTAIDPSLPTMDLGFQLSFMAVLGIFSLASIINKYLHQLRYGSILSFLGVSESFSASLFTAPILLLNDLNVHPISLLANALIGFIIPFAFFASLLVIIMGTKLSFLSWSCIFIANFILSYVLKTINFLSHIF